MGAVVASLKSHPGELVGVRAEPQSCSYNLAMCLGIFFILLKLVSEILLHLILLISEWTETGWCSPYLQKIRPS